MVDEGPRAPVEVGGFRIVRPIGAGGMGRVLLAVDPRTGVERALKVLAPSADADARLRFAREAQALAAVDDHEAVLRIHATGTDPEAGPYLVMAYAPGGDLGQRLRRGPLPPGDVAALGRRLARGLAHVHARGVLHRDLKPANVLFDEHGLPRLADFGLARLADHARLTETGTIVGTPAYMAPEQAEGRGAVDARTDVYGLGAVLYHALTGRPPFEGAPMVRPSQLAPGAPPALEAVVLRALAKSPADRFASAAAMADALEGAPRTSPGGARAHAGGAVAAVVVVAVVTAVAAVVALAPSRDGVAPAAGASDGTAASSAAGTASSLPSSAGGASGVVPSTPRPSAPEVAFPAWWADEPEERRPRWPLPAGLVAGVNAGEYVHVADGSVLRWIPARPGGAGFFLGAREVTWGQWLAASMRRSLPEPLGARPADPGVPVTGVSWAAAREYCRAVGLRLPTGDEWVWAARGPTSRRYPWGDEEPDASRAVFGMQPGPSAAGGRAAGASYFGCLDMAGNAYEWADHPPADRRQLRRALGGAHDSARLESLQVDGHQDLDDDTEDKRFNLGLRVARDP